MGLESPINFKAVMETAPKTIIDFYLNTDLPKMESNLWNQSIDGYFWSVLSNSSASFTNAVTTNLQFSTTKMNVVIYIRMRNKGLCKQSLRAI